MLKLWQRLQLKNYSLVGGGGGVQLPVGGLGIWYADEYIATPRPHIPNATTTTPTGVSLMGPSRRVFSSVTFYNATSVTMVDETGVFSDGSSGCSSLTATGNWNLQPVNFPTLTNGQTYTMAVSAQRNTGSDQTFSFMANGSRVGVVKTATATMQRYTHTFVANNSLAYVGSSHDLTGASLLIRDLELFSGAADLHQQLDGHLMLGRAKGTNEPSVSGGEMDLSNGTARTYLQFEDKITFSEITVQAVASKVAAGSAYQAFLTTLNGGLWTSLGAFFEQAEKPTISFAGTPNIVNSQFTQSTGLWKFLDKGYHLITASYGAGVARIFIDDVQIVACETTAYSAQTFGDFWVGALNSSFGCGHKWQGQALWNRALTKTEIESSYEYWLNRCASNGVALSSIDRWLFAEGDSITASTTSPTYPHLYGTNTSIPVMGAVWARSSSYIGTTAINMQSRKANLIAGIPTNKRGRKFIISIMITNDLLTRTSAQYLADLASIIADYRAAGFDKIVLGTPPPRANSTYNTTRSEVLATLRSWEGVTVDAIFDLAADATYGPDAAGSNVTYYPDGVHPSAAVEAYWEANIYRPIVDGV